ncbi:unnamed protein product [Owenia fusiformis]|uniref:Uncharacterized protein n=1 Tax=Owenia fusiformis TaxID=6347 RepID=A0A8S4N6B5_OWEFU|nr:unnamed protein product [Owenia fusiformis]
MLGSALAERGKRVLFAQNASRLRVDCDTTFTALSCGYKFRDRPISVPDEYSKVLRMAGKEGFRFRLHNSTYIATVLNNDGTNAQKGYTIGEGKYGHVYYNSDDDVGALYYVVAVVLIYGLSIVLMIGSHIRKNKMDKRISSYLKEMSYVRKRERRDQLYQVAQTNNKLDLIYEETGRRKSHIHKPVIPGDIVCMGTNADTGEYAQREEEVDNSPSVSDNAQSLEADNNELITDSWPLIEQKEEKEEDEEEGDEVEDVFTEEDSQNLNEQSDAESLRLDPQCDDHSSVILGVVTVV